VGDSDPRMVRDSNRRPGWDSDQCTVRVSGRRASGDQHQRVMYDSEQWAEGEPRQCVVSVRASDPWAVWVSDSRVVVGSDQLTVGASEQRVVETLFPVLRATRINGLLVT
jgi:hypothetical protein